MSEERACVGCGSLPRPAACPAFVCLLFVVLSDGFILFVSFMLSYCVLLSCFMFGGVLMLLFFCTSGLIGKGMSFDKE